MKAIKIWREKIPNGLKPEEFIQVLKENEVSMLSELEHENITKYYEFFIENNQICAVLEYCQVNLINEKILFSFNSFKIIIREKIWITFWRIIKRKIRQLIKNWYLNSSDS
jgi:serine/threonine protein kinase